MEKYRINKDDRLIIASLKLPIEVYKVNSNSTTTPNTNNTTNT